MKAALLAQWRRDAEGGRPGSTEREGRAWRVRTRRGWRETCARLVSDEVKQRNECSWLDARCASAGRWRSKPIERLRGRRIHDRRGSQKGGEGNGAEGAYAYMISGASMPSQVRERMSSRWAMAAVASRKARLSGSDSVRMWCLR